MTKEFLDGYWGVWRTIKGNCIFIREGESLESAIKRCNPKLFQALTTEELSELAKQEIEDKPKYQVAKNINTQKALIKNDGCFYYA